MSGRKDYGYELEQRRRREAELAIQARRAARSRQTAARLKKAKQAASRRASELRLQQRSRIQDRLAAAVEQNQRSLEKAAESSERNAAKRKQAELVIRAAADAKAKEIEQQRQQETVKRDDAERIQQEISDRVVTEVENLLRWQENLSTGEETQGFAYDKVQTWNAEASRLIDGVESASATEDMLRQLQTHLQNAETIETEAGEISDRYYARNEVMQDIIGSLKEIGFFVQDPEFADADRPDGAVIIRASRGDQTMMTEVDLDQKVRSDWQGVHGEYCTDGFFEFVQAMNDRGVGITPDNPDLKPRLLQKGAKDLPASQSQQQSRGRSGGKS